jgi:hypothetical protein
MFCESKINVHVCYFVIDKHVNSWNKLFIVVTFMKTFAVITSGIFVLFNEVLIQINTNIFGKISIDNTNIIVAFYNCCVNILIDNHKVYW